MGTIQFKLAAKILSLLVFIGMTACTGQRGFEFSQRPSSPITDGGLGVIITPSPEPTPSPTPGTIGDGSPSPSPTPSPSPSHSESQPDPQPQPDPSASPSASASASESVPTPEPSQSESLPQPEPSSSSSNPNQPDPDPTPTPIPSPTPTPTPTPPVPVPSPSTSSAPPVVCDPNAIQIPAQYGLKAELYAGNANYADNVDQLINSPITEKISADIFLGNLSIPTVRFTNGFTTTSGEKLKDNQGHVLVEYFALDIRSQIALAAEDREGDYQIALLADDGVRLDIQGENGHTINLINDDGIHPTQMSCANRVIHLRHGKQIPFELKYFQGPREHIALTMMWRRVERSSSASGPAESLCGTSGNGAFWNSDVNPSAPTDNFVQLIANGWSVMKPLNFVLEAGVRNMCSNDPGEDPGTGGGEENNESPQPCTSYLPLPRNHIVPARGSSGACYYKKLVTSTQSLDSSEYPRMRRDLIARNHDGGTPYPRIMGAGAVRFTLAGPRDVVLSSTIEGETPMIVDNFILTEMQTSRGFVASGYGTEDSLQNGQLLLRGQDVPFESYAPWGQASVPALHLEEALPLNETVWLKASSFDCGVVGHTDDIYVVFR